MPVAAASCAWVPCSVCCPRPFAVASAISASHQSHVCLSPKIEECENEHPDQVDEMPVESHDLDVLVAAPAAGEEPGPSRVVISAPDLSRHDDQEDHPERHMGAVKAG